MKLSGIYLVTVALALSAVSCSKQKVEPFSLVNPARIVAKATDPAGGTDAPTSPAKSLVPVTHPLIAGPLPKDATTWKDPNAVLVDPRGPKVASRCAIDASYVLIDGVRVEWISDSKIRIARWGWLERVGLCTRAASRCSIADDYVRIDSDRVEYISDAHDRVTRWIALERSGLCTLAPSHCSIADNYVRIDSESVEYISDAHDRVERWIELERTPLCYGTGRCGLRANYITVDGRDIEYHYDGRERLTRLLELFNSGICGKN